MWSIGLLLSLLCVMVHVDSNLLWESPHSVDTHNELSNFHTLHGHSFGLSDSLSHTHDPTDSHRNVLKVSYAKGSYSHSSHDRGAQFYIQPSHVKGHDEMTLSYDVYFDHTFQWVKGGKLPGLWGGEQTCSGGRDTDNCFSTRFMWRNYGHGEVYAYITHDQSPSYSSWCSHNHVTCNSGYGQSIGRGNFTFHHSRWQTVAQYVKLNRPGHHDGILKVWYNNHLVYELSNIIFRKHGDLHIDGIFFSTFYGGSSDSWAATADTFTLFRNFRLYDNLQTNLVG